MKRILTSTLVLGVLALTPIGLIGCGEETKSEVNTTETTPGGKTTTTTTEKVDQSGQNPPPATK
jgi:hypothetical protein